MSENIKNKFKIDFQKGAEHKKNDKIFYVSIYINKLRVANIGFSSLFGGKKYGVFTIILYLPYKHLKDFVSYFDLIQWSKDFLIEHGYKINDETNISIYEA
jgi:hypothetical protein